MFFKYFLALCALVCFAGIVSVSAVPVVDSKQPEAEVAVDGEDNDDRNPALAIAMRVIAGAFRWAATHCVKDAAQHCKQHWKHIHALKDCAGGWLNSNRGRCVTG